jgi:hypothetical protein
VAVTNEMEAMVVKGIAKVAPFLGLHLEDRESALKSNAYLLYNTNLFFFLSSLFRDFGLHIKFVKYGKCD